MTIPFVLLLFTAGPPIDDRSVDYLRDVKPVLARRCYACHGALKRRAGLRLDTAGLLRRGGDTGPAIEVGQAADSLLIDKVTEPDPSLRMPPEGEPLTAQEIQALRAWIDSGAPAPANEAPQPDPRRHWAFQPPTRPAIPGSADSRNPIDAFLAAARDRRGLSPRPPADKATLLRRVHLDLTGLAPTREELHAFLEDTSDDAYERVVDRLLASPRHGERWGRHWMDVWRYSDWAGFAAEVRESRPHIWRWRDWIVESLNEDKGYDRMVVEMLAADELAPEDEKALRATGYLARNWYKFNRNVWLQNTVDHTAKAFLGMTLACARCHDHKYDPISQSEYYQFRAFFEPHDVRTDPLPGRLDPAKDGLVRAYDARAEAPTFLFRRGEEKQPDKDHPLAPALPRAWGGSLAIEPVAFAPTAHYPGLRPYVRDGSLAAAEETVRQAAAKLDDARRGLDAARAAQLSVGARLDNAPGAEADASKALATAETNAASAERALTLATAERESIRARLAADAARHARPPDSKKADLLAFAAGRAERQAAVVRADAALARAETLLADARQALNPADPKTGKAVASAETGRDAARKQAEAARGEAAKLSSKYTTLTPVYPATSTGRRLALGRWMIDRNNPLTARVAVNHVWMRHFGQPLVSTVFDFGLHGQGPSHPELLDWLAVEFMEGGWSLKRLHRLIVTSEAYRLQSSDTPDDPQAAIDPENQFLWRMNPRRMEAEIVRDNVLHVAGRLDPTMGGPDLDQATGLITNRRSIYYRHAPEKLMTFLKVFDAANTNACYRRDESVVPHQALALANSPLALAQSRLLGQALSTEVGAEPAADAAFVTAAFERVLSRPPTEDERAACEHFLDEQSRRLADAGRLTAFAEGPAVAVAAAAQPHLRARESLVHVLMNHNDFVTIR